MAVNVTNYSFGNVGRMYARQNVPAVYGKQKAVSGTGSDEGGQPLDSVVLSPQAPRPLSGDYLEQAVAAGRGLGQGQELSAESTQRLREDRIFAAVSALAMLGHTGEDSAAVTWPGGIPAPTPEELEVARRRLAQRPRELETASDPAALQHDRLTLLERLGKTDTAVLAGNFAPAMAV